MDLPPYLRKLHKELTASPPIDSLSSLLTSAPPAGDHEFLPGIGKLDEAILEELTASLGVEKGVVESALSHPLDNAVKVAYKLLQDRKTNHNHALDEQDSTIPLPTAPIQIPVIPPAVIDYGGPVVIDDEDYFSGGDGDGYTDDDEDGSYDGSIDWAETNNFNVLDSSLVSSSPSTSTSVQGKLFDPPVHHLASYANSRMLASPDSPTATGTRSPRRRAVHPRDQFPKQPKWHFGIRSSSPPMEVMLEIYRTLQALGIQWREKMGIWGVRAHTPETTGHGLEKEESPSSKEDEDVYYVECRWRVRNIVILIDLQLYQVDAMNYLVDFRDIGSYPASAAPGFEPLDDSPGAREKKPEPTNPLLFLDCACRLIFELAGGSAV